MSISNKVIAYVGICVLVVSISTIQCLAANKPSPWSDVPDLKTLKNAAITKTDNGLNMKVKYFQAKDVSAYAAVLALSEAAGIKVGFELLKDENFKPINISAENETVFEVFDRIYFADDRRYTSLPNNGYRNFMPEQYRSPGVNEVGDKSITSEPPEYAFLTIIDEFMIQKKLPAVALTELLEREPVRRTIPNANVEIFTQTPAFSDNSSKDLSNVPITMMRKNLRVRELVNLTALASGKNWVAFWSKTEKGKDKLNVQFFNKASEVCPDAAKVQIELEPAQSN